MTFGLYLLLTAVLLLFFAIWVRRLVVRRLEPERVLADLREEIGGLMAELNQTGDHNISLLEDRISELRRLIADADRQIDDLTALLAEQDRRRTEQAPPAGGDNGRSDYGSEATGTASPTAAEDAVYTVSFSGAASRQGRSGTGNEAREAETSAHAPVADAQVPEVEPAAGQPAAGEPAARSPREQVRELHAQGVSPDLIASQTGMAIGEVELIISLGSRRRGP
tara:strand:+ start:753 stop:1424 length:672 start_codon:yes stop_codon:yes gene_type:complete